MGAQRQESDPPQSAGDQTRSSAINMLINVEGRPRLKSPCPSGLTDWLLHPALVERLGVGLAEPGRHGGQQLAGEGWDGVKHAVELTLAQDQ
jgi:hypothetical protein